MARSASTEQQDAGSSRGVANYRPFFVKKTYTVISVFFTIFSMFLKDRMSTMPAMQTARGVGNVKLTPTAAAVAVAVVAREAEVAAPAGRAR